MPWTTSSRPLVRIALALGLFAAAVAPLPAAEPSTEQQTARVTAGRDYGANGLYRFFFGSNYRRLWTTPVALPVLDLGRTHGGLTPVKEGGGMQTSSLQLEGRDGRTYRFRSVDKDPSKVLPRALRVGFAEEVVEDQTSAQFPAGAVVVARLEEAASLPHPARALYVMPDDARLGEFRQKFKGMVGVLEEKPKAGVTRGFEGFDDLDGWEKVLPRFDSGEARLDVKALLRARVFDVWIGDWDRHELQWEWAHRPGTDLWVPVPKDRDAAFSSYEGLVLGLARPSQPRLVRFDRNYSDMLGMMWNSRILDRRWLSPVPWSDWVEAVTELQRTMTDEVIEGAVQALPPEWYALEGAALAERLKIRRNALREAAQDFYRRLSEDAEVHGTDRAEGAEVIHDDEGGVEIALYSTPELAGAPWFRRRYVDAETDEVRLYLHGGDDRVVTRGGRHTPRVLVRVVGGPGHDSLDDSAGGHTQFYDHEGPSRVSEGPGTRSVDKPYTVPLDRHQKPLLDWGGQTVPLVTASAGYDLGILFGVGLRHLGYGFRKHPYAARYTLRADYATARQGFRLEGLAEFNRFSSNKRVELLARASDIEVLRFHGFGNESDISGSYDFFGVDSRQLLFRPRVRFGSEQTYLRVHATLKHLDTDPGPDRLLGLQLPYGVGSFGQLGAGATLAADTREKPAPVGSGLRALAEGNYYPAAWSVREPFGEAHGELAAYLTAPLPLQPTLALRAGGKKVWGLYPFHEAAYVGGPGSVRGFSRSRYGGDEAVYGSAELRLALGELKVFTPMQVGIFGLADGGRVFLEGEDSDEWHTALGGGIWLAFVDSRYTVSGSVAVGEDGASRFYVLGGMAF